MTTIAEAPPTAPDPVADMQQHQLRLPDMDGYTAQRLSVGFSGGVDLLTNDASDVRFIDGLKLGQEVTLTVTATVTGKGFKFTPGSDEKLPQAGYGVGLKVHSLEAK